MEELADFFYQYFDEDFNQWNFEELSEVYSSLGVFLEEYYEQLDRRAFTDLDDLYSQIEYYFEDNEVSL